MPGSGLRLLSMATFGAWLLFCVFSCSGILGWRKLLFTGAVVQVTFLLVLIAQQGQDNEMGMIIVKNAFVYLGIWWAHLLAQYLYQTRFPSVKMA